MEMEDATVAPEQAEAHDGERAQLQPHARIDWRTGRPMQVHGAGFWKAHAARRVEQGLPPHPEGARQTRGARPGLCGLGKGELRAHDGLPGFVRLRADPCHEVTRPESNKLTVPLRWKSVVTVGDRLVGDGVGDCWLHASAFSPSPAADPDRGRQRDSTQYCLFK